MDEGGKSTKNDGRKTSTNLEAIKPESISPLLPGSNQVSYPMMDLRNFTQVTQEMITRMQISKGKKRGRIAQGFTEYCENTQDLINDLSNTLNDEKTSLKKKKKLRNQISAFQARLKKRIINMDQELRLE